VPTLPDAVLQTVLYADLFDYALTSAELHHYLLHFTATPAEIAAALAASPTLVQSNGYVTLAQRTHLADLRPERQRTSAPLWRTARHWASVIGALPFVRMVAVTGALAMNNAPAGDDVDFLIVTTPGRVWLARALTVGVVRVARCFGVGLCPNYVLSSAVLEQQPQNLFIAHDLAQMTPLVGLDVYAQLRAANRWVEKFLPHAAHPLYSPPEVRLSRWGRWAQRLGEWGFSGALGAALEGWERARKQRKFMRLHPTHSSAVQLDADHVKGHFNDHGHRILQKFHSHLARYLPAETPTSVLSAD
jgi:hypothetical protein